MSLPAMEYQLPAPTGLPHPLGPGELGSRTNQGKRRSLWNRGREQALPAGLGLRSEPRLHSGVGVFPSSSCTSSQTRFANSCANLPTLTVCACAYSHP